MGGSTLIESFSAARTVTGSRKAVNKSSQRHVSIVRRASTRVAANHGRGFGWKFLADNGFLP
jgi:hypothetical protein